MNMFSRIKVWLYSFKMKGTSAWTHPLSSFSIAPMPEIMHEDVRSKESVKRVIKAFEDQKINMQCMALKAHDKDCPIVMCDKNPCFQRVADKIVGRVKKVKLKTDEERIKTLEKGIR